MTKNFDVTSGVVIATITRVPNDQYFFCQNGDSRDILCHCNQGGRLSITIEGRFVMNVGEMFPPNLGEKVVLIRENHDPDHELFTKAKRWIPVEDWEKHKWAINFNRRYRVIAYNYKFSKKKAGGNIKWTEGDKENFLADGLLGFIMSRYPRYKQDALSSGHVKKIGEVEFTYTTRWEYLADDGRWIECADPRPENK